MFVSVLCEDGDDSVVFASVLCEDGDDSIVFVSVLVRMEMTE